MGLFRRALNDDEAKKAKEYADALKDQPANPADIKKYEESLAGLKKLIDGKRAQDYECMIPIYERLLGSGRRVAAGDLRNKIRIPGTA